MTTFKRYFPRAGKKPLIQVKRALISLPDEEFARSRFPTIRLKEEKEKEKKMKRLAGSLNVIQH